VRVRVQSELPIPYPSVSNGLTPIS
jgi:hypothetical protein